MADSRSSESSFISRSDYLDFGASMEGEHNERVHEPVVKIRPLRFEPLGRTWNRARESEEDHEPLRGGRLNQESENGERIYAFK